MQSNKPSNKSNVISEKSVAPQIEQTVPDSKPAKRITKKSIAATTTSTTKKTSHRHSKHGLDAAAADTLLPATADSHSTIPAVDVSPTHISSSSSGPVSLNHDEIARLAYTFWEERNYATGFAEEDWFRAIKVLSAAK